MTLNDLPVGPYNLGSLALVSQFNSIANPLAGISPAGDSSSSSMPSLMSLPGP